MPLCFRSSYQRVPQTTYELRKRGTSRRRCFGYKPLASKTSKKPRNSTWMQRLPSIVPAEAKGSRGVVAVLTATDMDAAGVGNVGRHAPLSGRGGKKLIMPNRPALARDRVMHVGEPVAIVIAETALAAQDAAERVIVEYEEIKPVIDVRDAVKPDAPQLW